MADDNFENFKLTIDKISNNKLCEIIVANRYLGIMRDEAIESMTELAKRRAQGDQFQYEKHIDELFNTLPKINIDLNKILKSTRMF